MYKKERKIFEKLPYDMVDIETSLSTFHTKKVLVGPKKYVMQPQYRDYALDIYNFEARPDDVYLIGYPRSGTTLHREMVWLIANDLDYEEAAKDIMLHRFPHLDSFILPNRNISEAADKNNVSDNVKETAKKISQLSLKELAETKGRRFIFSHLPISLLPPHIFEVGAKVIYCARNPKDVVVSFYRAKQFFKGLKEDVSFEQHFNEYKDNVASFGPYFEHVKEAWARRNDENFLFIFYEDTINDKKQTMLKIAQFLGKTLSTEQLQSLEDHLNVENFRNNKSVNVDFLVKLGIADNSRSFIGKGKTGSWKDYFVGDLEEKVNEWIEKNLKNTDLKFPEV